MYQTILKKICQKYEVCIDVENIIYGVLNPVHPCKKYIIEHDYELNEISESDSDSDSDSDYSLVKYDYQELFQYNKDIIQYQKNIEGLKKRYDEANNVLKTKDNTSENEKNLPSFLSNMIKENENKIKTERKFQNNIRKRLIKMGFNPEGFFHSVQSSRNTSQ